MNSQAAVTNDPFAVGTTQPEALLEQAKRLLAQGRPQESEALFRELAAFPTHAAAGLYGIGLARATAGDLDAARSSFEQALERSPTDANTLYQLGALAERRGASADARLYYERAIALLPGHAGAKERLQALATNDDAVPAVPIGGSPGSAIYAYLRQDATPLSRQTVAAIDALETKRHPTFTGYAGARFGRFVVCAGLALTAGVALLAAKDNIPSSVTKHVNPASVATAWIAVVAAIAFLMIVIAYSRIRSMTVAIAQGRLQIRKGIVSRRLINIDLWHVQGVELERSFLNRLSGDGTLVLELIHQPRARSKHEVARRDDKELELYGLARGDQLEDLYQQLLNVVFLLRSNPVVKGIIQ